MAGRNGRTKKRRLQKECFDIDCRHSGIYSLHPFTPDEKVAVGYLTQNKPDLIINVVDSTNLERNLLLTTQLLELDCPLVVALNMSDEAKAKGININAEILKDLLGCKFFISASKTKD